MTKSDTMQSILSLSDEIHTRALAAATRYKRAEAELIEILQQVEEHRIFIKRGHSSLFNYVTAELGLAENIAYSLITVARKAREVPELKSKIESGALTLTNARRIAPILTSQKIHDNTQVNAMWIQKASELSSRQLEKEISKVFPREATRESASYVTPERVELKVGLSEREMLRLRRAQDLLSQSKKRPVSLEETLQILCSEFLGRHDPLQKAKRQQVRKGSQERKREASQNEESSAGSKQTQKRTQPPTEGQSALVGKQVSRRVHAMTKREPIPANILHQVNLRDQRRCTHESPTGSRCNQARWIEIHHKTPVRQGGGNTLENLITLCSAHHRYQHLHLEGRNSPESQ